MKRVSLVAFVLVAGPGAAMAADPPVRLPQRAVLPLWTWTGLYAGGHIGGGFGITRFEEPAAPIYGGSMRSPQALVGAQVGYNWQLPGTGFVVGAEADASILESEGTNTCLASSGAILSANCRVSQSFAGTLAGRVGYAFGRDSRTMVFAKGGAAMFDREIEITTNGADPSLSTTTKGPQFGWMAGAGVERALTPAWSMKLEYNYLDFGTDKVGTPQSFQQVAPGTNTYVIVPAGTIGARQAMHAVKLGVNLKLGEDSYASWRPTGSDYALRGAAGDPVPGTQVEFGTRVWYSFGRFQKDLGGSTLAAEQNFLVSRLTYDTSALSGEAFARADTMSGVFFKGFAGAGKATSGKMHDEDWLIAGATVPYSNTLSDPVKATLGYATVDVGYALFRGANTKVGGFLGYNYLNDSYKAYGCSQLVNPNVVCVPTIPSATLGITEDDHWHSIRVGLNGVVTLADGLTLTGDAAWLPMVVFRGVDNHVLRTDVPDTLSPEQGYGQGVQLEALLSYSFDQFSIGAGGRYWAMWANKDAYTNIFGTPCPCQTLPARTERYGAFVQASYKFDALR